jgi:hypothetical protein
MFLLLFAGVGCDATHGFLHAALPLAGAEGQWGVYTGGHFGVGLYSVYLVADWVEVVSKAPGGQQ